MSEKATNDLPANANCESSLGPVALVIDSGLALIVHTRMIELFVSMAVLIDRMVMRVTMGMFVRVRVLVCRLYSRVSTLIFKSACVVGGHDYTLTAFLGTSD